MLFRSCFKRIIAFEAQQNVPFRARFKTRLVFPVKSCESSRRGPSGWDDPPASKAFSAEFSCVVLGASPTDPQAKACHCFLQFEQYVQRMGASGSLGKIGDSDLIDWLSGEALVVCVTRPESCKGSVRSFQRVHARIAPFVEI